MRLDKYPVFRKAIHPWYDSDAACFVVIFFMILVGLFGVSGISTARETAEYRGYMWVPILCIVMSGAVVLSTAIRLIKRFAHRYSREEEE